MFSPRSTPGSGRRQQGRTAGRKSVSGAANSLLFSQRRTSARWVNPLNGDGSSVVFDLTQAWNIIFKLNKR